MIRVTDRTLSCLDKFDVSGEELRDFAQLLVLIGVDWIEMSEKAFKLMGKLPEGGKYVLRLKNEADSIAYRDFDRFVCRNTHNDINDNMCTEIILNDIHERYIFARYHGYKSVRICGLYDLMLANYESAFRQIHESFNGFVELCPTNHSFCATAIAAEWISSGGRDVVTSFGGIGGFAATEEIILHLKLQRVRKVGKTYPEFPKIRCLLESVTGLPFALNKPILGEHIFVVESGIHVDGIIKQPKCYEPFPPKTVGQSRRFTLSKQSSTASIHLKLSELGISIPQKQIPELLLSVKKKSIEANKSISDEEFIGLVRETATSI
ncbi:hypothetical protein LQZ18_18145 [Lachnospiraceae bacterium ZAX-1]